MSSISHSSGWARVAVRLSLAFGALATSTLLLAGCTSGATGPEETAEASGAAAEETATATESTDATIASTATSASTATATATKTATATAEATQAADVTATPSPSPTTAPATATPAPTSVATTAPTAAPTTVATPVKTSTPSPAKTPTPTPTPKQCPTPAQAEYFGSVGTGFASILLGMDYTSRLIIELASTPAVLYDNSWRLDLVSALAYIEAGANLIEGLATPVGAEQIHGQMLLIAYRSHQFVDNVANGIDNEDGDRLTAAGSDIQVIRGYITDLNQQVDTFCN